MSDFRTLSASCMASPQIGLTDIAEAKAHNVSLIINNRPDGEEAGQITGAQIEQAARDAGLDYRAIPIGSAGFGEADVQAMADAISDASGNVLAYCRTGTRSTLLWSLAQAYQGGDPEEIAAHAKAAGYDVSPVRAAMDMLSAKAG